MEQPAAVEVDHKAIAEVRKDLVVAVAAYKGSAQLVFALGVLQQIQKVLNLVQERIG